MCCGSFHSCFSSLHNLNRPSSEDQELLTYTHFFINNLLNPPLNIKITLFTLLIIDLNNTCFIIPQQIIKLTSFPNSDCSAVLCEDLWVSSSCSAVIDASFWDLVNWFNICYGLKSRRTWVTSKPVVFPVSRGVHRAAQCHTASYWYDVAVCCQCWLGFIHCSVQRKNTTNKRTSIKWLIWGCCRTVFCLILLFSINTRIFYILCCFSAHFHVNHYKPKVHCMLSLHKLFCPQTKTEFESLAAQEATLL